MLLSNKLTLCLTFFILLAFVAVPVMAHPPGANVAPHTHPLNENIPVTDRNNDGDTADLREAALTAHNDHPEPTISSDDDPSTKMDGKDGNKILIVEVANDDTTGDVDENAVSRTFTLLVDFDGTTVVGVSTLEAPAFDTSDPPVETADSVPDLNFTTIVLDKDGGVIANGVTVTAERKEGSNSQFVVTVLVAVAAVPDGNSANSTTDPDGLTTTDISATVAPNLEEITVRIRVNSTLDDGDTNTTESAVYSLATRPGFAVVPGGASVQSNLLELTLVDDIGDEPTPTPAVVDSISSGALNADGEVDFIITLDKPLSEGPPNQAFTLGMVEIEGGRAVDFVPNADGMTFVLTVMADVRTAPITVTAGGMSETSDPAAVEEEIPALDLKVTAPTAPDADGNLVFTITSNVPLMGGLSIRDFDIDTREAEELASGDLVKTADADLPEGVVEQYMLTVTPKAGVTSVLVELRAGAATYMGDHDADPETAEQEIDTPTREALYTPETGKPTIAFAISNLDTSGLAENPGDLDSVDGGMVTITASDTVGLASDTEIVQSEVSVENGSIMAGSFVKGNPATFTLIPNIGALQVKVTVAANAVHDGAGNGNAAATSAAYKVGPWFAIPANTILVITKTMGVTHTYLSDQPRLPINAQPPTPAANIKTDIWHNMPDLEVLFNLSFTNGGTLNLTEAVGQAELPQTRDGDKNQRNAVRISEVMWAVDLSKRGGLNDEEAAEQWVEITNDTGSAVSVFLFARTGRDSAINVDNVEDRIGNAYNGSPGSAGWKVPGQDGNSWTGVDFISMHRSYVGGDNRGYVNGTSSGHWKASDREYLTVAADGPTGVLYDYIGSPGRPHSFSVSAPDTRKGVTQVPSSPVIINEVANRHFSNSEYEWIELRNVTGNEVNLRNWMISMVYRVGDTLVDVSLVQFPNNDNAKIAPNGVILLLASDPRYDDDHPIAVGYNVDVNANDQVDGLGLNNPDSNRQPPRQKVFDGSNGGPTADWGIGLPDGGDFILILRKQDNYEGHRSGAGGGGGKGVAELGGNDVDKIVDIAGSHRSLDASNYPASTPAGLNNTTLWPLVNFNGDMRPNYGHGDLNHRRHNRLDVDRVRYRQHVKTTAKNNADGATPGNRAGTGVTHKDEGVGHYAFRDAVYTGLGYRRTARADRSYNHGTPGYDGNSVGNTGIVKATAADAKVTISEIMTSTGPNAENPVFPQWIELYNSSPTDAVNLRNWKLRFETLDADGDPMDSLMYLNFNSSRSVKTIPPQQTVLVVAGNARQANSDSATGIDVFNENRVFNVYRDVGAGKFGANTRYMFFNPTAFNISVVDKDNKVVDTVGNLDGDARTSDTAAWDFPMGVAADSNRTSFIRIYDDGVARAGMNTAESNVQPMFKEGGNRNDTDGIDAKYSWIPAVNTEREFKVTIKSTWYGDEDDYGTPGHRVGLVLPVELSSFRPTLEDGVVTVRWTTESELDNAGFNIYRSETRDGEYKQVNTELIEGAGTTGERSVYSWVDQTAKPGVVYYYQIEDVSFAGDRQALAITKLKGLISAKNKLTTTWSELKEASQ